ncbi:hypothetical protein CLV63_11558 [Murinocardiopsis flavida]|uniref:Uncharacterized protein n=1 Tax=Murinocardiopsis flavida TaxID=645275 RepID=A0A2P8DDU6_9ACTN|nr:hypothetical protein CLV63_11558 [Murinocardiopsis flavida]
MRLARSAERAASGREPASKPSTRTEPELGRSRVPSMCSIVDLPDPEGPTMATSSPRAIDIETPSSAVTPPG